MRLERISITELNPPSHPVRAAIDEEALQELADDIRRVGVIVPIAVKQVDNRFEVIHGHRRLLAAMRAEIAMLPCLVWEAGDLDDTAAKLHENFHREDLSPVEEAAFYAELYEALGQDVDAVCKLVRENRSYVEGRLLLLQGDRIILEALARREISIGVSQQLNKLKRAKDRAYLLEWAIREGATVSKVADWCRQYNQLPDQEVTPPPGNSPAVAPPEPLPNPNVCFLCGSDEDPWEFEFHYIHKSCRRRMEAEVRRREAGVGSRESGTGGARWRLRIFWPGRSWRRRNSMRSSGRWMIPRRRFSR